MKRETKEKLERLRTVLKETFEDGQGTAQDVIDSARGTRDELCAERLVMATVYVGQLLKLPVDDE